MKTKKIDMKNKEARYGGPDMYPLEGCPGWFTNQAPPHLLTDEDKYVIRWDLKPKSYFRQLTAIGPAFGATLAETPRFDSVREAQDTIDRFGIIAEVGCEVETVRGRTSLARLGSTAEQKTPSGTKRRRARNKK